MSKTIWTSEYFCGNKVSEYGLKNNRVDYRTLAKSFDCILVNDITKLFYASVNDEYNEVEQVNGYIDNSEEIEELEEKIEELEELEENEEIKTQIEELQAQIEELEEEQEPSEIYQYYIISDNGASILQDYTDEIVYYLPLLDCYVWGVTHFGTSWDYVLTDIEIKLDNN